ncbi:sulfotransferase family 2 domain-containing protein [Thermodesulfobacteriota bacterium]
MLKWKAYSNYQINHINENNYIKPKTLFYQMSHKTQKKGFSFRALPLYYNNIRSLSLQTLDYVTGYHWHLYNPFMVFPKHKLAFLAIPRSGTSSIEKALLPLIGNNLDFELEQYKHTFRLYMRSCTRREVASKYNNYFKFTFVRNPWTRLYSCYLAKVQSYTNRHFRHLNLDKCRNFEEFVLRVYDIPDKQADEHFMSQDYLLTYKGNFLPDQVYRFETYTQDWKILKPRLEQITAVLLSDLPHYYKTKSDDYRNAYSTKLIDLVGERYQADCDRFGYTYPD